MATRLSDFSGHDQNAPGLARVTRQKTNADKTNSPATIVVAAHTIVPGGDLLPRIKPAPVADFIDRHAPH
jgi:hypothetical protein